MMIRRGMMVFGLLGAVLSGVACSDDVGSDAQNQAQIPFAEGSPEAIAVLAVANDQALDFEAYDVDVALHKKAAQNLVAHRDGDPETTEDDNLFDDLNELWGVSYCKSTCFGKLLSYAKDNGYFGNGAGEDHAVVFSPQTDTNETHLAKVAAMIDGAEHSIDIAMYSYSHQDPIKSALERAKAKGVKIRFLANTDLANSSSKGGKLETELGIDVRRVTKIMHHKFAIIDGPRDDESLGRASTARIASGSANWSGSAANRYDENTLFLEGYTELALRMQRDFDTLWAGSKDVVFNASLTFDPTRANITDELIAEHEDPNVHAYFTSGNFKARSNGSWSSLGTTVVTDRLVQGILSAEQSLEIASGHFVSEPIAQAVVDAMTANPGLQVRIVLDCQEASKGGLVGDLKDDIETLGGDLSYKCNSYRWHYKFAEQMHHKYIIVDGDELYTGSLNFSDNSETNSFENMLYFTGPEHAQLIASYQANIAKIAAYGHADNALQALMEDLETADVIPLVWQPAITMTPAEFQAIKDVIRDRCPATKSWENTPEGDTYDAYFNDNPYWFDTCDTTGYPWTDVPSYLR